MLPNFGKKVINVRQFLFDTTFEIACGVGGGRAQFQELNNYLCLGQPYVPYYRRALANKAREKLMMPNLNLTIQKRPVFLENPRWPPSEENT